MRQIRRRSAVLLSATLLGGAAFTLEPAALRDLEFRHGESRLSVGAVRTSLWSAAFAQAPDQVVLENITIETGPATYRVKRLEFSGITSTRAEIEAIFDKTSTEPLPSRLAKVSARQVTIPEIVTEQRIKGQLQTSMQRNTVLSNVRNGLIAEMSAEGMMTDIAVPEGKIKLSAGRLTSLALDVPGIARIYVERAGPQPEAPRKLQGAFTLDGMEVTGPDGLAIRIARISGSDFYGRPLSENLTDLTTRLNALAERDKPDPQDMLQFASVYGDFLTAFDVGSIEAVGMTIVPPRKDGVNGAARIARMSYTGAIGGKTSDARLEGLEVTNDKGMARLGAVAFTGFSFGSTAEGLKALGAMPVSAINQEVLRKLIPTVGTMRVSGLDFDFPDDKAKDDAPRRLRFALKELEFTADKPLNGIPTNIRLGLQNFTTPLPADSTDDGLRNLIDLGYKGIDLSFTTAANWVEPGELVIREISTRIAEAGSLSIKGVLGNVTRDVFNADSAVAMVALIGATAKSLDITVENSGLFDRFLALEGQKQSKTAETLRREYGTIAAVGIPAMLGNSPQARTVGQAVARFIAKPGRLAISARTRDAAGLGVADVMALGEPAQILDRLEVTATAE